MSLSNSSPRVETRFVVRHNPAGNYIYDTVARRVHPYGFGESAVWREKYTDSDAWAVCDWLNDRQNAPFVEAIAS